MITFALFVTGTAVVCFLGYLIQRKEAQDIRKLEAKQAAWAQDV